MKNKVLEMQPSSGLMLVKMMKKSA